MGVLGQQAIRWWGNLDISSPGWVAGFLVHPSAGRRSHHCPVVCGHVYGREAYPCACVCVPVKPTRGYYVTTRGCAIEPKGSMSLPRSHYIIVGAICLIILSIVKLIKNIIKKQPIPQDHVHQVVNH